MFLTWVSLSMMLFRALALVGSRGSSLMVLSFMVVIWLVGGRC